MILTRKLFGGEFSVASRPSKFELDLAIHIFERHFLPTLPISNGIDLCVIFGADFGHHATERRKGTVYAKEHCT